MMVAALLVLTLAVSLQLSQLHLSATVVPARAEITRPPQDEIPQKKEKEAGGGCGVPSHPLICSSLFFCII